MFRASKPSRSRAVGYLLHQGILEIRAMSAARTVLSTDEGADPGSPYETDYLARIQLIADVCHEFAPVLMNDNRGDREEAAADALSYRFEVTVPEGRRWMRARLAELGEEYRDLLGPDPA
ncbi:hypothetical protein [Actinopolymorpha pittospori]